MRTFFMLTKKNRNTVFERLLLKKSHYSTSIWLNKKTIEITKVSMVLKIKRLGF